MLWVAYGRASTKNSRHWATGPVSDGHLLVSKDHWHIRVDLDRVQLVTA